MRSIYNSNKIPWKQTPDQSANHKPSDQLSGPQGIDKDPTRDPADNPNEGNDLQQSQKAKKVDADPEEENKKSG
jgi:hypothetical protein